MPQLAYTNPVYPGYFADPYVWRHEGEYYAIGTGPAEAAGHMATSGAPTVFPLMRSRDLIGWEPRGRALVRPEASLGDSFWAPEIVQAEGVWWMYYSVGHGDRRHQLRVARSEAPLGPYVDCAQLTDPAEVPFAIDPHPFQDEDGRWYLFHARDFLGASDEAGRPVRAGTALVVYPLASMTALAPGGRTVARARFDWQRFAADREMYGRRFDWHTLEGPFVLRHEGRYFCLYSGGCWQTPTYGVDYLVADSVMGPYSDEGAEAGPRVLRTVPGRVLGPGHCSVTRGPDGSTLYVVYHAWGPDLGARRMCIDRLEFTAEGPRSPGPTWTPQPLATAARSGG
jgi:arabinan endo-1,5-alpha-L-arabinosidase